MSNNQVATTEGVYRPENVQVIPTPRGFYEWLYELRERPWRLQKKTLECLRSWLNGYQSAKQEAGMSPSPDERGFEEFDLYVCEKYGRYDNAGWCAKIAYYNQDDTEAFDAFFNLLDQFRLKKQKAQEDSKPTEGS